MNQRRRTKLQMGPKTSLSAVWTQSFPPAPHFTDNDVPGDLSGKVYLITGANSGMGAELSRILYAKHARVYLACRSEEKGLNTIKHIKTVTPKSRGQLIFLQLDLADLTKVKMAATSFLAKESKLHVLFNNAGVMVGPSQPIPRTSQGYELALGVNCIAQVLLVKLLTPILVATARTEAPSTVRVVWLSSLGLEFYAPEQQGIDMGNLDYRVPKPNMERYGISKCGDWLLAVEYARLHRADGIVSVPINPGNIRTALARDQGIGMRLFASAIVHPIIKGVYTQLFAAFSPEIALQKADWTKEWVIPWGRISPLRPDLPKATKPVEEGGNGNAKDFWEWNEAQIKQYL